MMAQFIHATSLERLDSQRADLRRSLTKADGLRAVIFDSFLTASECREYADTAYMLQSYWRAGTLQGEYTLGRAWYTSIDNREVVDYFDESDYLNRIIRQSFPGLIEKILHFCQRWTDCKNVGIRSGWAGPGIVVFHPSSSLTAKRGGSVHIDYEGLSKRMLDAAVHPPEVYSFMLPLQMPVNGGHLRTWPEVYRRYHHERYLREICKPEGKTRLVPYSVGSLCGIYSLRIHQIEPFRGKDDRVILTFHLGKLDGQWCIWF